MTLHPMHAIFLSLVALLFTSGCKTLDTQAMEPPRYTIIGPDGSEVSQEALFEEALRADVVLVGETHDNPSAHHLEYALLKGLIERRTTKGKPPLVALSLEMLARDLQPVTDEYLTGLITELHFMAASRPWGNYSRSYRKMINLAKEKGAPVIAANAPRRYVNLVAREGKEALTRLSPEALGWIAPLPYKEASPVYRAKLKALEERFKEKNSEKPENPSPHGEIPAKKPSGINPDSQALWDATMAWSIAEARQKSPETLVMHITGAFHCEGGLGIPEHLALYAPSASVLIITIRPPQMGEPLPPFQSNLPVREYTVQTK
ncbi:hypothetical protein DSLASN_06710 [Desulfoluna limicola]|uniref:Haem-binding uptake Tiki superfamily ChaN domain-containing protein n=1 Tax=Desulfoluna limicola TaxID=2810562 RepID=A0ABN6EZC8_9BACT|nr:ChaN family lipoprotein [Desulfoluna limicola]BCS95039.1 hypothetical protein DSLASN_06710 [Desulfoluna limicola]